MKHIFYGKELTYGYSFSIIKSSPYSFVYSYGCEIYQSKRILDIDGHITHYVVYKTLTKEEDIILASTDLITERVLNKSYVRVNNKETHVDKVIQCENGDVLCYTSEIIKENEDAGEKDRAIKTMEDECAKKQCEIEEYNKKLELNKDTETKSKRKWWQFWK